MHIQSILRLLNTLHVVDIDVRCEIILDWVYSLVNHRTLPSVFLQESGSYCQMFRLISSLVNESGHNVVRPGLHAQGILWISNDTSSEDCFLGCF
jgi:hypothetical protein